MYEELIKNLRHDSAFALQNCEFDFVHDWMLKAANAIEDLQKRLDDAEIENIKLKEEFAKCRGKHRWIPLTERLPEHSGNYLVYSVGGNWKQLSAVEIAFWDDKRFIVQSFFAVTHWTPLPQPPEEKT